VVETETISFTLIVLKAGFKIQINAHFAQQVSRQFSCLLTSFLTVDFDIVLYDLENLILRFLNNSDQKFLLLSLLFTPIDGVRQK